jgi:hypothetical protein
LAGDDHSWIEKYRAALDEKHENKGVFAAIVANLRNLAAVLLKRSDGSAVNRSRKKVTGAPNSSNSLSCPNSQPQTEKKDSKVNAPSRRKAS